LPKDFYKLLPFFEEESLFRKKRGKTKNVRNAGRKSKLPTSKIQLFYALHYLKVYPTFDVLGATFGMDRGTACKWAHRYADILLESLERANVLPKRKFKNLQEFIDKFPEIKIVITDGTERRKRRPKDKNLQKEFYSGKKNVIQ